MSNAELTTQANQMIRRPLGPNTPVTYWKLGETAEERYDVADQPMAGEMDPFFFLTKHKNFIPHEYPCRTQFAAERRGKRPLVESASPLTRYWLPFQSPRVDLSGFWFRPTIISTVAETNLVAQAAGEAKVRLRTCGGAILSLNGAEVGWFAPYGRNLESAEEFTLALAEGINRITIAFDDLAERDARYYFQLDYLSGPKVEQGLEVDVDPSAADQIEAALSLMHFEKPAYRDGEVALLVSDALSVDCEVDVTVEGDFMSIEEPVRIRTSLKAGDNRLVLGQAADLPPDFRHFNIALTSGGFTAARVFGVDICHAERQGQAAASLEQRIDEALTEVADNAEQDTVCALARLSIGKNGPQTEAIIANALAAIEDCHDCADFILVPLLWIRKVYAGDLSEALVARIDNAILNYRYWMDEPGNDVQWYFSENHALLFHTAAYLAGHILPDARFVRSGRLGAEQSAIGAQRVRAWLDHFEKWEMAEFNSAPYFPIDLKGLCILFALAPDADIRERAKAAVLRLVEVIARSAHHGIMTGAQGRSYEHTLRASSTLELTGIARMLWGKGNFGKRFHALPQLALCIRDHGLSIPDELTAIASIPQGRAQEWAFAQGQDCFARLYHYKNAAFSMGSAAAYRWNQWGYQETVLHIRMGENPDAQIWVNHPGEELQSGYGRPSYWGGCGTLPRVHQYKSIAVLAFDCHDEQPDFTHAWFPTSQFDTVEQKDGVFYAKAGDAFAYLSADVPLTLLERGPTAGNELRAAGRKNVWVIRMGDKKDYPNLSSFAQACSNLAVDFADDGTIAVEDPQFGTINFRADGSVEAEGRMVDPAQWTVMGEATVY